MRVITLLAEEAAKSQPNALVGMLPFLLLIPVMYFLLIRPQRRRQREQQAMQSSIEVGDEVMTTSGIYGFVTSIEGDVAWLEIDDNVQIRISRLAIQRKVDTAVGQTAATEVATSLDGSKVITTKSAPVKPSDIAGGSSTDLDGLDPAQK